MSLGRTHEQGTFTLLQRAHAEHTQNNGHTTVGYVQASLTPPTLRVSFRAFGKKLINTTCLECIPRYVEHSIDRIDVMLKNIDF